MMNSNNGKRGGFRVRRFPTKEGLSEIDCNGLAELIEQLAPKATKPQRDFALAIVTKGIELFREHAPSNRALTDSVRKNRRALAKFKKGKAGGPKPFNSLVWFRGKLYGASSDGLFQIDPNLQVDRPANNWGLDEVLARSLSNLAAAHTGVNGIPFNPSAEPGEHGKTHTVADILLEGFAHPRDWDAELAGFVYLAIVKALGLKASTYDLHQFDPTRVRTGANYCRLLVMALIEAGAEPPVEKLRPLMLKGRTEAQELLAPAIEYSDGRTASAFDSMFQDSDPSLPFCL